MELTDVSTDAIVALAKQEQTKWCLVPKILTNTNPNPKTNPIPNPNPNHNHINKYNIHNK